MDDYSQTTEPLEDEPEALAAKQRMEERVKRREHPKRPSIYRALR